MFKKELEDFLIYLQARLLSKNTFIAYKNYIERFLEFLKDKEIKSLEIESLEIINFLKVQYDSGLHANSVYIVVSALKTFYRFLKLEGVIKTNILKNFPLPKISKKVPEVLTEKEIHRLFLTPNLENKTGRRDLAILEILYGCGLRVSELVGLLCRDIDFKEKSLRVTGKGNKQRVIPINNYAIKALKKHWKDRDIVPSHYAIVSRRNTKLDRFNIFLRIKRYGRLAGIKKAISPHTLRHSYATHMHENGADLAIIQALLGHENITTTADIYIQLNRKDMIKSFYKHSVRKEFNFEE